MKRCDVIEEVIHHSFWKGAIRLIPYLVRILLEHLKHIWALLQHEEETLKPFMSFTKMPLGFNIQDPLSWLGREGWIFFSLNRFLENFLLISEFEGMLIVVFME